MKKEFDFNTVGKKMPYDVDESFFESNAAIIGEKITFYDKKYTDRKNPWFLFYKVAALIVIALVIGVLVNQNNVSNDHSIIAASKSVDKVLKNLSDNDLKQLENMVSADPFLTDY